MNSGLTSPRGREVHGLPRTGESVPDTETSHVHTRRFRLGPRPGHGSNYLLSIAVSTVRKLLVASLLLLVVLLFFVAHYHNAMIHAAQEGHQRHPSRKHGEASPWKGDDNDLRLSETTQVQSWPFSLGSRDFFIVLNSDYRPGKHEHLNIICCMHSEYLGISSSLYLASSFYCHRDVRSLFFIPF